MSRNRHSYGFTLIEISIVVVIIGLILSAVFAAVAIRHNAEIKTVIDDLETITRAVSEFEELYGGLPGDLWDADRKLTGGTVSANSGDGAITTLQEELLFWRHLSLAQLVTITYDGATNTPDIGVKSGPIRRGSNNISGYRPQTDNDNLGTDGLYIELSLYNNLLSGNAALTTKDAFSLDAKLDDGVPTTGRVIAVEDASLPANSCITVGNVYDLSSDDTVCILRFYIVTE